MLYFKIPFLFIFFETFFKSKKRKVENPDVQGCKVIMFPNGAIQTNSRMCDLIKMIKPFIIHFLDSSALVNKSQQTNKLLISCKILNQSQLLY